MSKSTTDNLLDCYQLATKLSRAHKQKLVERLAKELGEKRVAATRGKKGKREEPENRKEGQG